MVLDQSFLSLSECWADAAVRMPPNVICVRSLTKDHGIPGVRVGYLIARPDLCRAAESCRSNLAQVNQYVAKYLR